MMRAILTAGVLVLVAAAGPVGSVITVDADATPSYMRNSALATGQGASTYLSAYIDQGNIKAVPISPADGSLGTTQTIYPGPSYASGIALAWNPGAGRYLAIFVLDWMGGPGASKVYGLVLDGAGVPVGGSTPIVI